MRELFSVTTAQGTTSLFDSMKEALMYMLFLDSIDVKAELNRVNLKEGNEEQ